MKEINLTENVHQRMKWLEKQRRQVKENYSPETYQFFLDFDNQIVMEGLSTNSRHKNLTQFVKFQELYVIDDWKHITEKQIKIRHKNAYLNNQ